MKRLFLKSLPYPLPSHGITVSTVPFYVQITQFTKEMWAILLHASTSHWANTSPWPFSNSSLEFSESFRLFLAFSSFFHHHFTSEAFSNDIYLKVLPLAELVHLPLVAAPSITTSIANPKPRMSSRNNSIDPPDNLVHKNNLSRNNSIDPPGNVPNWNLLESFPPREPNILTEEHSILLNQMIRRNNGDENQKTLETLIRSSLVRSVKGNLGSATRMDPNGSVEFRGYGMGTLTSQQG